MKMRMLVLAMSLSLGGGRVWAHEGHDHPAPKAEITEDAAKGRASDEVKRLVANKKLDASWANAKLKSMGKRTSEGRWEWLATFENGTAPKDKVLYVFLQPSGEFSAANFTGK